jgi:hypothetical protein
MSMYDSSIALLGLALPLSREGESTRNTNTSPYSAFCPLDRHSYHHVFNVVNDLPRTAPQSLLGRLK